MSELLGLVDAIESTILESKKIPFSDKIVIEEKHILGLLDKLRFLIKNANNSATAREAVDQTRREEVKPMIPDTASNESAVLLNAKKEVDAMKKGANEYADNMLARLQLVITKMQKHMIRMEQSIEEGRSMLDDIKAGRKEPSNDKN